MIHELINPLEINTVNPYYTYWTTTRGVRTISFHVSNSSRTTTKELLGERERKWKKAKLTVIDIFSQPIQSKVLYRFLGNLFVYACQWLINWTVIKYMVSQKHPSMHLIITMPPIETINVK